MDYIKRCKVIEHISKLSDQRGGEMVELNGERIPVWVVCAEAINELEEVIEDE